MVQKKKTQKEAEPVVPFQIADKDKVQELQKKKERILEIMEFIKEEWLDTDKEFMKEIFGAIEDSL